MKKTLFITTIAILFLAVFSLPKYYGFPKRLASHIEKKPNEWFFMQRAFPYGEINHEMYMSSQKKAMGLKRENCAQKEDAVWELAGPLNIGGRITDVEMPGNDLQTIYIGTASGGVFKSSDAGNNWEAIFDEALSLSIGDID
ncbi:MAG: hypothetical protein DRJ05_11575, partial [Bacteroidetes bacterium]